MIVLDASVLIAYLDRDDSHHDAAEQLLAEAFKEQLGASTITLAEVLVAPARYDRLAHVDAALRDLEVTELTFPPDSAQRLAILRVRSSLKMPDCCVLLAAADHEAAVATFDGRLAKAARGQGLAVLGMPIA